MKVEIELPEIDGYEYTGEYRCPKYGEYYLAANSLTREKNQLDEGSIWARHILRPVSKWIVPDANTPIGVKARFKDNPLAESMTGVFWGVNPIQGSDFPYLAHEKGSQYPLGWKHCEVLYPYEKVDIKAND